MHLYLRNKEFSTEVFDICLRDGCYPSIGRSKLGNVQSKEDNPDDAIEPAIWFKVLVLDSISVDCERRAILWNTVNDVPVYEPSHNYPDAINSNTSYDDGISKRQRVSESMYIGGECYGYHSDLDEVFDNTDQHLRDYVHGHISKRQFHDTLLKLLHCYILPSIHLTTEDMDKVSEALKIQEGAIRKVDKEILAKNAKVDEVTLALKRLEDQFITEIMQESQLPDYPPEFISMLIQDISNSIEKSWENIESVQNSVEDLKKLSLSIDETKGGNGSKRISDRLDDSRKQRDSCFEKYHSLLVVRETLKERQMQQEALSSKARKPRRKPVQEIKSANKPLCDVYMGMHETIHNIHKDTIKLTDKKLLVISVKEALRATLDELSSGEDSYGLDVDKTGLNKATDVLGRTSVPKDWQTLSEQIASIILNPEHPLGHLHKEFCEETISKCQAAIFERELYEAALCASHSIDEAEGSVAMDMKNGSISVENKAYHLQRQRESAVSSGSPSGSGRSSGDSGVSVDGQTHQGSSSNGTQENEQEEDNEQDPSDPEASSRPASQSSFGSLEACSMDLISQHSLNFENLKLTMDPNAKAKQRQSTGCLPFARLSIRNTDQDTDTLSYSKASSEDGASDKVENMQNGSKRNSQSLEGSANSSDIDVEGSLPKDIPDEQLNSHLLSIPTDSTELDTSDDLVIIYDTEKNYIRKSIDGIKNDILKHFDRIVKSLQETLEHRDQSYYRKIWLTYESHFYQAVVQHIIKLYEVEYSQITKSLSEVLPLLTLEDLELEGSLIAHMLQRQCSLLRASNARISRDASKRKSRFFQASPVEDTSCKCLTPISEGEESSEFEASLSSLDGGKISDGDIAKSNESGSWERFLRHFSAPIKPGSETPPRTITVYHPTSITVVYDRRTWPIPHKNITLDETAEPGLEATSLNGNEDMFKIDDHDEDYNCSHEGDMNELDPDSTNVKRRSNVPEGERRSSSLKLKPRYLERFSKIFSCFEGALEESAPLLKLQHLTKCLRELSTQVSYFQMELYGGTVPTCADDLIDILVVLLCNYDPHQVGTLYSHVMLLSDVMAPFFTGGPFSFSLVQFAVAYQFIQDKLVLKKRVVGDSNV